VAQQRSTLHYWSKHKGTFGVVGIKSIFLARHTIRYLFGTLAHFFQPSETSRTEARVRASSACLQALLWGPAHGTTGAGRRKFHAVILANSFSRVATYWKRHGLRATAARAAEAANRFFFSNRMVLFYFDLADEIPGPPDLPSWAGLERKRNETEI